jgi:hypothetical protein
MPLLVFPSPGFLLRKKSRPKNGTDAGGFQSLGFLRSKNPKLKIRMDADFEQRKG